MNNTKTDLNDNDLKIILHAQTNEITEYHLYHQLAKIVKNEKNKNVLQVIGNDELKHYNQWKEYSGIDVKPKKIVIFFYYWISIIFGITFGIKLMEKSEKDAHDLYAKLSGSFPEVLEIVKEEDIHEQELLNMIDEDRLKYIGSIVLGLNDALVELTGALAGLTFALQNTKLIAIVGLVTGIAASFSMAASEYLSIRSEENSDQNPIKSAIYTGIAYIFTVIILVMPYLIFNHYLVCLGLTIFNAILIIFLFNFYISIAQDLNFWKRFGEMSFISIGVAILSFLVGVIVREFYGVDV